MTKRFLKRLGLGFSAGVLAAYGIIYACADGDWGLEYSSNFTPETYVDKSYSPLFLSGDTFYDIHYDDIHLTRFNDEILKDWKTYLGKKMDVKAVEYLLLNDTANTLINDLYLKKKNADQSPWFQAVNMKDKKVNSFVTFMYKAKKLEAFSTQTYNYWDYENFTRKQADPTIVQEFITDYDKISDKFLKNRYWFQVAKGYFYANDLEGLTAFINRTEAKTPKNSLYYRALAYQAGLYHVSGNYEMSNYLFARVFDQCPTLRVTATYNFKPQNDSDFFASINRAKDLEEKSALWAMQGYYGDLNKAISEIYKINPKSKHLDFLLTRLVNGEESVLAEIAFQDLESYKDSIQLKVDKNALALVKQIASENRTKQPYLWTLAAGYLSIFNKDYSYAAKAFAQVEKTSPKTHLAQNQIRLLKLYNSVSETTKMDKAAEGKLLEDLNWLYNVCPKDTLVPEFRYEMASGWTKDVISRLYAKQGNIIMAELFKADPDFYYQNNQLESMKKFLSRTDKNSWEKLAEGVYETKLTDIYEFQAIFSAYKDDINQAIVYMEQAGENAQTELFGNPFNGKIKDCNDCDHEAPQKVKYSKLAFLKKMKEMKEHIANGKDVYANSLLLGNAYYNMSYFGNARVFYDSNSILNEYGNFIGDKNRSMLNGMGMVRKYYQHAFKAANNKEQKAKIAYLMAKCERNDFYTANYFTQPYRWYNQGDVDFIAWQGFQQLRDNYSDTKYYREVINECGYFKKYLGM